MSHRPGVRLSRIVTIGGVAIAALAFIAALATVTLTSLMREGTETVQTANHMVRAAVDVHEELVSIAREAADGRAPALTHDRRAALGRALVAARAHAATDEDRRLVDTVEARVRELGSGPDALQAALAASDTLVDTTSERAATIETKVGVWDAAGNVVGIVVGLLTLLGVPAVLFGVYYLFTRPMLRLGRAIRAFGAGDKSARAPASGPAELVAVASAFNDAADSLAQQDQERLAFLGGVAHDLRNPLSALRLALHFVQPSRPLPGEAKLRDTLALVSRQVTLLDRMVGDFLDAVRIQRGELDLRLARHDLRDLARSAVELYANASRRHPIVLSVPETPVEVAVDGMRVEQVLNNLVSNAIKYSPAGGEVAVTVRRDGGDAILEVHDQGVGISDADRAHIFEPFRRNRGANELASGVGLGLAVARRIVDAHLGTIEVESAPDRGSTFRVRLPLVSSEAPERDRGATRDLVAVETPG